MCENVFAHRLLQPFMNMLECTCKYLVNTGQHASWLCLPCTRRISPHTVRLWLHAAKDVIGPKQNCSSGNVSLTCWISTVVILQISHCYCALIWAITARTRRSVSQVLIDRHPCLSNAGSNGASQMIFFILLNKSSYSALCLSLVISLSPRSLNAHT